MSTRVLSNLREFLNPMFDPVVSDDDSSDDFKYGDEKDKPSARFGHIRMPPYRLGKVSLMESVRQIFMKAKVSTAEMLFVVPDMERDLGIGVKDDGSVTPVTLTFSELFDTLRLTKKSATNSQWGTGPSSSWAKGQALPLRAVLVICLDPHMSADCALSLLGIVKWALEQSSDYDLADICVLTVSAEKDFNFLSKVVSFSASDMQVASIDLATHGKQDPAPGSVVIGEPGNLGYAGRILQELRARTDCRRLIVSFDGKLEQQFKQQLNGTEHTMIEFLSVQSTVDVGHLLNLERSEQGPKTLFITFEGEVPFLPLQIQNFDEFHLVLGSSGIYQETWDEISRQVIVAPHGASMEDRHLQLWWINQPSIPARFLYTGTVRLPQFLQAGRPRLRLVENVQLGGFIASLADIASWGINTDAALSCFVRQPQRAQEMTLRLHIQRLITKDDLGLSENEANVFRTVLSPLGYDHRLALLVALDCGPEALRVKVQLAVMLKHGTDRTISINTEVFKNRKKYNNVVRGCHGLGSSLAHQGTMWLNLGLLKRHQKISELHDGHDSQQDPLAELVRVRPDRALLIGNEIGEILDRLVNIGISVDNTKSVAQEAKELSLEAKGQLHDHLVRAFTHSLVVTENHSANENDAPLLSHRVMSTWVELMQEGRAKLIDINSFLKKEEACAFGICHDFARNGGGHHLLVDWTYIPGKAVGKWRSEFMSDVTFYEMLNTDVEHNKR